MSIWQTCEGERHIQHLKVKPWRVVEAQHILSARDLVDTSDEHDILEALLEQSKPAIEMNKNYLIDTPFRYPPLKYGSRFGGLYEPSLWYGSLELKTALAEVAYYMKKFHADSTADLSYIETMHTAFQVKTETTHGVDLTQKPFHQFQQQISHPIDYEISQQLGSDMRQSQVKAFLFTSARCPHQLTNFAAFDAGVFHPNQQQYVFNQQSWWCISDRTQVEFKRTHFNQSENWVF